MKIIGRRIIVGLCAFLALCGKAGAQNVVEESLSRHNFFYAGQSKRLRMFKVQNGAVAWTYDNAQLPKSERLKGEISDAILMSDGHILMAHQFGITEIDADGKAVWHYDAPHGCEIHTV